MLGIRHRRPNLKQLAVVCALLFCLVNLLLYRGTNYIVASRKRQQQPDTDTVPASLVEAVDDDGCAVSLGADAEQAIARASTDACKRTIASTACALAEGRLTPRQLQRSCPVAEPAKRGRYVGCFADSVEERLLTGAEYTLTADNSPAACIDHCVRIGYQLAGLQYSHECFCGHRDALDEQRPLNDSACQQYRCPGAHDEFCGGFLTMSVYNTGFGKLLYKSLNEREMAVGNSTVQAKKVRIVFLLQLNGRNTRQVRRLLKSLYRPHHYYFVHVDARQNLLYRDMQRVQQLLESNDLTNFHVTPERQSSIWGGASLLTVYWKACQQILKLKHWHWDFVINMSESDMLVAPMQQLEALLARHAGYNFLRSHGASPAKFIERQGLNFVFAECDQRMWRVGKRDYMPNGVWFDGGSDWVTLSRDFVQFVIEGDHPMVAELRRMYANVLLPVESFFHTVAYNTVYCDRVINSNLKLTNWNRERGCHCQYKHVVDWCGCSPMTFIESDQPRLSRSAHRGWLLARKFDSLIDQRIIELVEQQHRGSASPFATDASMSAVWLNEYSAQADGRQRQPLKHAWLTALAAVAANTSALFKTESHCLADDESPQQLHVYKQPDLHNGQLLIVAEYTVSCQQQPITVQTLLQRRLTVIKAGHVPDHPATLQAVDVSSDYDVKERVFRNYVGLLDQSSHPTLSHVWTSSQQGPVELPVTIAWRNPLDEFVSADGEVVRLNGSSARHSTAYNHSTLHIQQQPLRPGLWSAHIYVHDLPAYSVQFGVYPSAGQPDPALMQQLTRQLYRPLAHCVVGSDSSSRQHLANASLPECHGTRWSSRASDPKSAITHGRFDDKLNMLV